MTWIDVEESLPKEYISVWGYSKVNDMYHVVFINDKRQWRLQNGQPVSFISHWQPIELFK